MAGNFVTRLTLTLAISACVAAHGSAAELDPGRLDPYLGIQIGGAVLADPQSVPGLELVSPMSEAGGALVLGAGFDRHWSAELAINTIETDMFTPGRIGKLAEMSMWAALAQVRWGYPLFGDRLVPYLLAGAGAGFGQINDRNTLNSDVPLGSGLEVSPLATVGIGLDYFVADNIALNFEAKQLFLFSADVGFLGRTHPLNLDSTFLAAGLRTFLGPGPRWRTGVDQASPIEVDHDPVRFYLALHGGVGVLTDTTADGGLTLDSPAAIAAGAAVGADLGRHLGLQIALESYETDLVSGSRRLADYTMVGILAELRLRYPMRGGRLVPYALIGGGLGGLEFNDRALPSSEFPINGGKEFMGIASFGVGGDYFLADNVAVHIEAKYLLPLSGEATLAGRPVTLDFDALMLGAGLRIYLF